MKQTHTQTESETAIEPTTISKTTATMYVFAFEEIRGGIPGARFLARARARVLLLVSVFLNKTLGSLGSRQSRRTPRTPVQTREDLARARSASSCPTPTVKCAFLGPLLIADLTSGPRETTSRTACVLACTCVFIRVEGEEDRHQSVTNRCHIREVKSIFAAD